MNFYLVGNVDIFMRFVFAIFSDMEMDERFHKKDDKCHQGNYDKKRFSFFIIYNDKKINTPRLGLSSIIIKQEIRVASYTAKCFGNVGAFNGVSFIIVPIYVLKAEDVSLYITAKLNIREVAYRAVVRRWWKIIFYKDAFAIEVGIFRPFFSDEVHFAGLKVGGVNESKWTHWSFVCV